MLRLSGFFKKQSDQSSDRSAVNTVALWDSRLTRRPFSRWTLLPIVDTKKKIETSENISYDFNSLSP